ncbi:MAG TPA: OsmC family protein [Burkholderiales bacterium]|nr:OsmC family protein [Burkholderiales bacterium]
MVEVRQKTQVRMKLDGECASHSRTDVSVRDVKVTIDEPIERGGTNQGPSPTETLMAALIACTNVITHKVARANGVHLHAMRVRLEADFDRRGVLLAEEVDVPFPRATLFIDVTTDADDAAVAKVKHELAMFCPVSKVIRASGTRLEEVWTVTRR